MTTTRGWRPLYRPRTHEQVFAQIEQRLLDGRLSPGDRLPPERELADQLGVSRAGVREALRILEALGVLAAGVGSGPSAGSVVMGPESGGGVEALATLLRLQLALARVPTGEVAQACGQLEDWCRTAAAGGDPNALLTLLLRAVRSAIGGVPLPPGP
ncbi:MAG TPA: GntR family transcriptional regulator [Pseudonocardia sp.]|nr:GntR family transcriptional regulator [Pseudonocardia sp.]